MVRRLWQTPPANSADGYGKNWLPYENYKSSRIAEEYDRKRFSSLAGRMFNALELMCLRRAFRDVHHDALVCDVPIGTGRLTEPLLGLGYRVHGVDISPAMLAVAQRKLGRFSDGYSSHVGDGRALGKMGPKYDAALCARMLFHVPLDEQISFLSAVAQATRDTVVITHSLNSWYQRRRRWLKRLLRNQKPVVYPVTNKELRALLQACGLREVRRHRPAPLLSEAVWIVAQRA